MIQQPKDRPSSRDKGHALLRIPKLGMFAVGAASAFDLHPSSVLVITTRRPRSTREAFNFAWKKSGSYLAFAMRSGSSKATRGLVESKEAAARDRG